MQRKAKESRNTEIRSFVRSDELYSVRFDHARLSRDFSNRSTVDFQLFEAKKNETKDFDIEPFPIK